MYNKTECVTGKTTARAWLRFNAAVLSSAIAYWLVNRLETFPAIGYREAITRAVETTYARMSRKCEHSEA